MLSVQSSIVIFSRLFLLIVFALLLFAFAIALFGLEFVFPELVDGIAINVREDDFEHVRVPGYRLTLDTFFDVLEEH
jgi:hypothetical protein